tara:strand:+ start:867 stop:1256 length:390 start_codon:yes stop_codon:yes gene_type:complete
MTKSKRTISRKCVVCGKRIKIIVYKDGHYNNGHYFNKLKIPIGKGQNKKVGTTKVLGKTIDVVKWTGKEKEVEYWECNKCYEEAIHENWLEETIEKLYGKKCKDYNKNCACCQAWEIYNTIIEDNRGLL